MGTPVTRVGSRQGLSRTKPSFHNGVDEEMPEVFCCCDVISPSAQTSTTTCCRSQSLRQTLPSLTAHSHVLVYSWGKVSSADS